MADQVGRWEPVFQLKNVACHASLLPDGKQILYWGRRKEPKGPRSRVFETMNETSTDAFILNIEKKESVQSFGDKVLKSANLFCSAHCWMPDGRLIIFGGHLSDGRGSPQACIFDPSPTNGRETWTSIGPMQIGGTNVGRWYPTAICLGDGSVLCISGSANDFIPVAESLLWRNNAWERVIDFWALSLYPQLQLDPKGRVFMSGPQFEGRFLDTSARDVDGMVGGWRSDAANLVRAAGLRDYAANVMYEPGKLLYIGGGNDNGKGPPTERVEFIDLTQSTSKWTFTQPMTFKRRQHNGTILPDGTVLVTGGTSGPEFNNVGVDEKGKPYPIHEPELFIPKDNMWNTTKQDKWITMAPENTDRCYHGVALLLPDGRVFSAGSGEWSPRNDRDVNAEKDSHIDAQIYHPPYLCKGGLRGVVTTSQKEVDYSGKITVNISKFDKIAMVSWMRIGSTTHSNNMSQSRRTLQFDASVAGKLTITAPASNLDCPPGHYMLFVLDSRGVPAELAPIIRLKPLSTSTAQTVSVFKPTARMMATAELQAPISLHTMDEEMEKQSKKHPVTVGLTTACPYGLGPCWGGAHEALHMIADVEAVRPVPSQKDAVAYVYLKEDTIPDIDVWRSEFSQYANGTYDMRGIEMTLSGVVKTEANQLVLTGNGT